MQRKIQREKAAAALKESEDQYRTLFENMVQGGFYQSADGSIHNPNAAALSIVGLSREEFQQRSSLDPGWDIIHEDGSPFPGETHPSVVALKTGKPVTDVIAGIFNPRTQSRAWVNINAIPQFRNGEERPYQVFVTFHDITSIKQIEKDKEELASRLYQAQKIEAIGLLAGGIAHDLNNILFPISGLAELLLEEFPPEDQAYQSLNQIFKSARRGSDLVKQILTFSRQSKPQKLPVRIQPIIKEVLKLVRATISMNIEMTSDIDADCGMVSADPVQLHQILMNLFTNAYHAVEGNGGTIHVGLEAVNIDANRSAIQELPSGGYACITVSDTGAGMDSTVIDKIFTPYFTTKEFGKGTGLGLAVVHGIVKEHGGDIQVTSEVGKGSQFKVFLPIINHILEKTDTPRPLQNPTGSERILLVDDEVAILRLEHQMLERLGYQLTIQTSSLEALETFKRHPDDFDLIISDQGMPNMTGEQLSRELSLIRPGVPIILCTGFIDESVEIRARAAGIKGFLKKPVGIKDLADMVRNVLDEVSIPN